MEKRSLFFEDYEAGMVFEMPAYEFTAEKIIDFAKDHDPRPFHLSEEEGQKTRFGRMFASGFHTLTDTWLQWVLYGVENESTVAGMGLDKIMWHKPVFAGDKITTFIKVHDKKIKEGKDSGMVTFEVMAKNQDGDIVITYFANVLIAKRHT